MSAHGDAYPVDLKPLHTFGLQAWAKALHTISTTSDLVRYADSLQQGRAALLLGEGSNTVFVREVNDLTVWKMALTGKQYLGCDGVHHHLRVMAGENWHNLVEWTIQQGWGGLENLALIPGSVGAGPVQNIGAYGVELKDRVRTVQVYELQTRTFQTLDLTACEFAYRESVFKQSGKGRWVITAVDFALPVQWVPILHYGDLSRRVADLGVVSPLNVLKAVSDIRTEKLPDPVVLGNSGSFFKNPLVAVEQFESLKLAHPQLVHFPAEGGLVKLAAGWLIEQCGLKGAIEQSVGVYERQALILVNHGAGQGAHLLSLIERIQQAVQARFGVHLDAEPNLIAD
ncbi:UDP-N-acetylmuramate dehydrogenase [Limnobacter humi]|uniref:UDP-N-acetylenolpyruvoylglucosamine reductase n=1 Tax=Limnobacter humi TaxID=1778671 RepID=A0ABT1WBF2_9BURK|nr:UDP-N-acetylmuramate dehydrogenase [Limnobacter humi]MCQ8894840.1 UDP-N-acetylmuramate dehydrogenase [Limnobacter humi]